MKLFDQDSEPPSTYLTGSRCLDWLLCGAGWRPQLTGLLPFERPAPPDLARQT